MGRCQIVVCMAECLVQTVNARLGVSQEVAHYCHIARAQMSIAMTEGRIIL